MALSDDPAQQSMEAERDAAPDLGGDGSVASRLQELLLEAERGLARLNAAVAGIKAGSQGGLTDHVNDELPSGGPAGPEGPAGPAGPAGPSGPAGPAGTTTADPEAGWVPRFPDRAIAWFGAALLVLWAILAAFLHWSLSKSDLVDEPGEVMGFIFVVGSLFFVFLGALFAAIEVRRPPVSFRRAQGIDYVTIAGISNPLDDVVGDSVGSVAGSLDRAKRRSSAFFAVGLALATIAATNAGLIGASFSVGETTSSTTTTVATSTTTLAVGASSGDDAAPPADTGTADTTVTTQAP